MAVGRKQQGGDQDAVHPGGSAAPKCALLLHPRRGQAWRAARQGESKRRGDGLALESRRTHRGRGHADGAGNALRPRRINQLRPGCVGRAQVRVDVPAARRCLGLRPVPKCHGPTPGRLGFVATRSEGTAPAWWSEGQTAPVQFHRRGVRWISNGIRVDHCCRGAG